MTGHKRASDFVREELGVDLTDHQAAVVDVEVVVPVTNPLTGNQMSRGASKYCSDLFVEQIRLRRVVKKSGSPTRRVEAANKLVEIDSWLEQTFQGEARQGR